jgi:pimeloyl-ACP methyl ester carboxylesterase
MSTNVLAKSATKIGGEIREFVWKWKNKDYPVVYETLGNGSPLLLLPAFSTVSMREEMGGLAKLLSPYFQCVTVDWIGFGDSARPSLNYSPEIYQNFLADFVTSVFQAPITVVAAGHSAGYVLRLAKENPSVFYRILLVAPTWRGPLPTMGVSRKGATVVKDIVRSPLLGELLYKINSAPSFLKFMYRRHVYVDEAKLTRDFIHHKWENTQKPGARFAPAAFVTGTLDPVQKREELLSFAADLTTPLMVVIGESSPPKSRAEMEALATLPGVGSVFLSGTLGMHEEYPQAITEAVLSFLNS